MEKAVLKNIFDDKKTNSSRKNGRHGEEKEIVNSDDGRKDERFEIVHDPLNNWETKNISTGQIRKEGHYKKMIDATEEREVSGVDPRS